jgi:hypothetical protein
MKAEQVAEHALSDLCSRDVIQLLDSGEEKQARAVMKMTGMSKTDVDKTVKEHEDYADDDDEGRDYLNATDPDMDDDDVVQEEMKKQTDMEEAVDLVEELLDWTHLDDMIKDYKKKSDKKDDDFLGCCISLRGQAKDFLKKHGREEK